MSQLPRKLANGHTAEELDSATKEKLNRLMPGPWTDVVRLQPDGWILTRRFLLIQERLHNFKFRPDDVVVMTYPKCGTTWSQEIVWNMRNNPNLDNPDVEDTLFIRSPYIEFDMLFDFTSLPVDLKNEPAFQAYTKGFEKHSVVPDEKGWVFDLAEAHTKPRTIKTHLAFSMLPKNMLDTCKVVYVSRNPMDNVLSAMHHFKLIKLHNFVGTQDDFVDLYVQDMLLYSPYGQHMREAWTQRSHPNLLLTSFEELKADVRGELKRLDAFMGTDLSDKQIDNVIEKTSFKSMQKNDDMKKVSDKHYNKEVGEKEGLFIRQGKSGTWKDKITPEQKAKLDAWITENFTNHGITFKYD